MQLSPAKGTRGDEILMWGHQQNVPPLLRTEWLPELDRAALLGAKQDNRVILWSAQGAVISH